MAEIARRPIKGSEAGWTVGKSTIRPDTTKIDRAAALRAREWSIEVRLRADGADAIQRLTALGGRACRLALAAGPRWVALSEDGRPLGEFDTDVMERLRRVGALRARHFGFGGRVYGVSECGAKVIHKKSGAANAVHSSL